VKNLIVATKTPPKCDIFKYFGAKLWIWCRDASFPALLGPRLSIIPARFERGAGIDPGCSDGALD
jgi:hypothetical protein